MSEIHQILEGIRVGFVDNVRQFRTKTSELDLIHNEYVKKFVDSVWSLFDGPTRFEGKAADELKTLLGDYKYAEATQTGHGLNGDISQRLDQAADLCESVANEIEDLINTFPFDEVDPPGMGGLAAVASIDWGKLLKQHPLVILTGISAAVTTGIIVTTSQQELNRNDNQVKLDEFIPENYLPPTKLVLQVRKLPKKIRVHLFDEQSLADVAQEISRMLNVPAKHRHNSYGFE